MDSAMVNQQIARHLETEFADPWQVRQLSQHYRRYGYVKLPNLVPEGVKASVDAEVRALLDEHARRIDISIAATGNTPRKMSTVGQKVIAQHGRLIPMIYESSALMDFLSGLAREPVMPCPWEDEKYVIIRQEKAGDTHGWHWGDFSFTVIWIIDAPSAEVGGSLQCIPHTDWDKVDPRLQDHLAMYPIRTYPHSPGDIYFLRSDTTLHRTIPLRENRTRIILNTCWGNAQDMRKEPTHETMEAMFE